MAEHVTDSIPMLIRGVVDDARELIREEIALARAEIREELSAARRSGLWFGAAALTALIAVVLLCIALGGAAADLLGAPPWAGYGLVALLLGGLAFVCALQGRRNVHAIRGLPKDTGVGAGEHRMDAEQIRQQMRARRAAIDRKLDLLGARTAAARRRAARAMVAVACGLAVAVFMVRRRRRESRAPARGAGRQVTSLRRAG